MSNEPRRQEIGLGVLDLLAQSKLAGQEEAAIISIAWTSPLGGPGDMDADEEMGDNVIAGEPDDEEVDDEHYDASGHKR